MAMVRPPWMTTWRRLSSPVSSHHFFQVGHSTKPEVVDLVIVLAFLDQLAVVLGAGLPVIAQT